MKIRTLIVRGGFLAICNRVVRQLQVVGKGLNGFSLSPNNKNVFLVNFDSFLAWFLVFDLFSPDVTIYTDY